MQLVKGGTGKLRWYTENNAVSFKNMVLSKVSKRLSDRTDDRRFRRSGSAIMLCWAIAGPMVGNPIYALRSRHPPTVPSTSTIGVHHWTTGRLHGLWRSSLGVSWNDDPFDTKMPYLDWMIAYTPILGNLYLSNGVINCAKRLLHLGMQKQAVFWYRPDVEDVKLKHRLKITCAGAESAANLDAGWGLCRALGAVACSKDVPQRKGNTMQDMNFPNWPRPYTPKMDM